jgi:hypothetical protein
VIRHVFERGLASIIARWMLEGTSDALFERIAKVGALKPEEAEKLQRETREHLERVRDEGAPQADAVLAVLKGVLASLPDLKTVAATATRAAVHVAAKSAEAAAARAQDLSAKDAAAKSAAVDEAAADAADDALDPAGQP